MDIVKNISVVFMSIFFESMPFLLIGALISSIIETFISDDKMAKLIPKNKILVIMSKKKQVIKDLLLLVAGEGLEPSTFGL